MHNWRLIVLLSLIVLAACSEVEVNTDEPAPNTDSVGQTGVDAEKIIQADSSGWLSHGRTYSEQRHSPLDGINRNNISSLGLSWSYDLGTSRGIEATPIVHDGVIYVTSTWNIVHALDAITGEKLWSFDPMVDKEQAAKGCCDVVNRGVALWGLSVFTATMDGRLISLNAKTGEVNWDIQTIDKSKPYTITGAPRIIKGKVIIGNGGAELGVRGYFTAYDAMSGRTAMALLYGTGKPSRWF